ncbi:SMP-30/gluconolactonase/LRE family protein [Gloeobacter violaceus]|uniref:SMP-30/gluconolactonase/LRE family protein n=1 Tax=Gloeobacter violaceus TaxID=33072 RepID=UPI0013E8C3ED|nr:SMP-30/gluconolactonase/LRE family protein [Gloeobacter violaceus]
MLVVALIGGGVYLWLVPSPIRAVAWNPPPRPPVVGPLAQNGRLMGADLIGRFAGPAAVAFDRAGRLYTGTEDGKIYRIALAAAGGRTVEVFADTGGRPWGLAFDGAGNLVVADARQGLLAIDAGGKVRVLAKRDGTRALGWLTAVAVAADGRVYFSEASEQPYGRDLYLEVLEARPTGRLLVYDPATNRVQVLATRLALPGGLALASGSTAVLVSEAARYRVMRYRLDGPGTGTGEPWIENLPGYPGGMARDGERFWLTIGEPRIDNIDRVHPNAELKNWLAKLPASWVRGNEKGYGLVLLLDKNGRILESLQDPTGRVNRLSNVEHFGADLYLATSIENGIARVRLAAGRAQSGNGLDRSR